MAAYEKYPPQIAAGIFMDDRNLSGQPMDWAVAISRRMLSKVWA